MTMSQMNDLATILDEMSQTGKALIGCGERLIKAAASMQTLPVSNAATEESPVTNPGNPNMFPSAGPIECPDTCSAKSSPEPVKTTRAPKSKTKTTANTSSTENEPASPAAAPEAPAPAMTKEEARAMLADLARNGRREEAKALGAKYAGDGSFSDIDPQSYPELAEEVKRIHG